MKRKTSNNLFSYIMVGLIGVILFLSLAPRSVPFTISEVSCTNRNANIWVKYTLANEGSRLSSLIADCAQNPQAGFVGTVNFIVSTPQGHTYNMGGYSATQSSSQKISCGTNQGGKEFSGLTIPNEGTGTYTVQVSGNYYLQSENYSIAHPYSWTDAASIECLTASSRCADGTALRQCSTVTAGKYCSTDAVLYNAALQCGCPSGMERSGDECAPIQYSEPAGTPLPPSPPPASPSPIIYSNMTQQNTNQLPNETITTTTIFGYSTNTIIIGASVVIIFLVGGRKLKWF